MGNKRKIRIETLSSESSLKELLEYFGKIVERFPDAKLEGADEYDDYSYYITIEVDKTELDLQLEATEKELYSLPQSYSSNIVPYKEVVISQDTPISEEVLEGIKNDGKNDKYYLSLNGCILERYFTKPEIAKLQRKADKLRKKQLAEREPLQNKLRELRKLRDEQDTKYTVEDL